MSISSEAVVRESGKSELRRRAILDVAREVFFAQGFAATSMSEVAARLGGSKGTLYNYFRSKEELFAALMIDACEGPANALFANMPPVGGDLRTALIEMGAGFLSFVLREPTMAIHRIVVAEAERFPEIGRIFYEKGPLIGQTMLANYFSQVLAAGQLPPADPDVMGRRFKDLILSDVYTRRLWGVIPAQSPDQIRAHTTESVDIFLAAFGPPRPGS